jgi:hypothetical protein
VFWNAKPGSIEPGFLFGLRYPALRLLSNAQLGQIGADRIERRSHLIRRGQQIELVRAACAILQQGRRWIAACVDLDRVQHNVGRLDVGTGQRLTVIDRILIGVPTVLRVQAVGQQDDDLCVLILTVHGGRGREWPAADE